MVLPTDVWDVTGWHCGTHYQEMLFGFTWGYSVLVKLGCPMQAVSCLLVGMGVSRSGLGVGLARMAFMTLSVLLGQVLRGDGPLARPPALRIGLQD